MRILIIVPHLSTGGMPQVALKRVEHLIGKCELYLVEYREVAWSYVVQRNKIKDMLGAEFISLGWTDQEEKRDKFEDVINDINPDIIHMEEIPEKFLFGMREEHSDWLYRKDRSYKIIETTHTSTFNVKDKKYFPDKFMFVSEFSKQQYSVLDIPSCVVEYPIEKKVPNKASAIKTLDWDSNFFNILNVGLFTDGKNQGYLFDIAEKLLEYKIKIHFVGNQATNFSNYWEPLMEKKLDNCIVYGERSDVHNFYEAADLVIHPSILELNPLVIKEATSYGLPVFLNHLSTYGDMYDTYKNVKYLTMNIDDDINMILDNFDIKRNDDNTTYYDILNKEYESVNNMEITEKTSDINVSYENSEITENLDKIEYNISFIDGARVEILSNKKVKFDVEIFDKLTNDLLYKTELSNNNWCATNTKYYKEYKIDIKYKNNLVISHDFDLTDKNVLIQLDSKSIGDTIAWLPYVEEFRKKHNCNVYCVTFWNFWFKDTYPNIKFLEPGFTEEIELYARYLIGWYRPLDFTKNPNDYKKIPLQKTASDILGLDFKEIKPEINVHDGVRPIEDKYVCIGQFSTANTKHWHYPHKDSNKGWQILVDWLNEQGYKVMVISKQATKLKNVIDRTGNFPIEHRMNEIKHCEFFIGVGSGLSWLAWAIGKKVVMISGFSDPICEFKNNNINIHNYNVCNGCFNKYEFDKGDWNWCPEHKDTERHFECSISITPKMVIDRIVNSKLIENVKEYSFDLSEDDNIDLNKDDINIEYNKNENKIMISHKYMRMPEMNIAIKNLQGKEYHVISDVNISNDYVIWCIPGIKLYEDTNKIIVSFYKKYPILDVVYNI